MPQRQSHKFTAVNAQADFPQIIDDLYAGTLDDVAWRRAIVRIADVVSGAAVFIFCVNPSTATVLRDEFHRCDMVTAEQYRKVWFAKDIRVEPSLNTPVGEPIFEARIMTVREWQGSEVYNDFLAPHDTPWFLAYFLHKAADRIVNFSINSTRARGPFNHRDGVLLRPLIPHVRRALEIKDRLESAHIRQHTVDRCFDSLSFGVLILDQRGRIVEASTRANELLLATSNGFRRNADGTLWLRDPAGRELNHWIANGAPPKHNRDGLLHLPRPLARPLSVMVTRLPAMNTSWFSDGPPCWMVLLFDPDQHIPASTDLIAHDLGISMREAELACLLVNGYDISVASQRLHISIHTARTHLKSIFSKTGIGSQAELVRRIVSGPAGIRLDRNFHCS
jgi:DNA-binding CsgD family transcriptional regulator